MFDVGPRFYTSIKVFPCELSSASTPQCGIDFKRSKFSSSKVDVFLNMYHEGSKRPEDLRNWNEAGYGKKWLDGADGQNVGQFADQRTWPAEMKHGPEGWDYGIGAISRCGKFQWETEKGREAMAQESVWGARCWYVSHVDSRARVESIAIPSWTTESRPQARVEDSQPDNKHYNAWGIIYKHQKMTTVRRDRGEHVARGEHFSIRSKNKCLE